VTAAEVRELFGGHRRKGLFGGFIHHGSAPLRSR
jgi:hypothetical protein